MKLTSFTASNPSAAKEKTKSLPATGLSDALAAGTAVGSVLIAVADKLDLQHKTSQLKNQTPEWIKYIAERNKSIPNNLGTGLVYALGLYATGHFVHLLTKSDKPDNKKDSNFAGEEALRVALPSAVASGTITQALKDKLELRSFVKKTATKTAEFVQTVALKNKQILMSLIEGLGLAFASYCYIDYVRLQTKERQEQLKTTK